MVKKPKIGAFVLETLTTGMYPNPLDTLREYIQNATDAIKNAERDQVLMQNEGRVFIDIDPVKRNIKIRDNGIGITADQFRDRLINIGISNKKLEYDAGFRGIGRLAGIAYCKNLVFRSSVRGEPTQSELTFDCKELIKAMQPGSNVVQDLAEVMQSNSYFDQKKYEKKEHFFEVELDQINKPGEIFLDNRAVEEYMSLVAPVDFYGQQFPYATKINDWLKHNKVEIPIVTLTIKHQKEEKQILKPFKTHYKTKKSKGNSYDIRITDVDIQEGYIDGSLKYFLWYGVTKDLLGQIDNEQVAGIRIRKSNLMIGGQERMSEIFAKTATTNSRFNAYYIGEIHVIDNMVIPNARRDNFEDNENWLNIKNKLIDFAHERSREIQGDSRDRNKPVAKVQSKLNEIISKINRNLESGMTSPELEKLKEEISKENIKTKEWLEKNKEKCPKEVENLAKKLSKLTKKVENEKPSIKSKTKTSLDRKQRKIIEEIIEILHQKLDPKSFETAKNAIMSKYKH